MFKVSVYSISKNIQIIIMSCILCLEVTESYKDLIVFNSSEWQALNMKYIIEKYLWKLEVLNIQSYICQACWQELYNFHKFYLKLEKAHSHLNDLVKFEEVTKEALQTGNEEETEKISNIAKVSQPEPEILFFREEYPVDIFEKEDEEASYFKSNSKRKCLVKKSLHDKNIVKNISGKRSNNKQSNTEISELKSNENPDEMGIKFEAERIENDKSDENESEVDSELKKIKNDAEDNKTENEEESIGIKRRTKLQCSRTKSTNDKKIIARKSSRKRSSKEKSKIETEIKKLKSDKRPDEIDKKLEVDKIEKDGNENSMIFDENLDELKTKLELEITENDAKQNKMEEDDQNDSSRNDDETSSDAADSDQLSKLSDEDKFIAENFQITCDICQIPMDTFFAMLKHYKDEHNQRGHVSCCNATFYLRNQLLDHINFHRNPEYFKCKHCGKVLASRATLKNHLKRVHEGEVAECDICGKRLSNKASLKIHKLMHKTEDISCNHCGKSFLSQYSLRNHKRIHYKKLKICDLCGTSIATAHAFRRHMLEHEGKTLPKIKCKMCDRQFSDKGSLNRHARLHHPPDGIKAEFKCAECPKVFAADFYLKSHMQKMHYNPHVRKCTLCDKTFKGRMALKEHISRHKGEPLYLCSCSKTFYSNGNYHTHRKICSVVRKEKCEMKRTEDEQKK